MIITRKNNDANLPALIIISKSIWPWIINRVFYYYVISAIPILTLYALNQSARISHTFAVQGHGTNFPNRFNIQNVSFSDTTLVYFVLTRTLRARKIYIYKFTEIKSWCREEKKPFTKCFRNLSIKPLFSSRPIHSKFLP